MNISPGTYRDKRGHWRVRSWEEVHSKSASVERFFRSCGRLGGQIAARNMTPFERSARAKHAVEARERSRTKYEINEISPGQGTPARE